MYFNKFYLPITFLIVSLSHCNKPAQLSKILVRSADTTEHSSTALIFKDNKQSCSGKILRHGIVVTAKHCFDFPVDTTTVSLKFYKSSKSTSPEHISVPSSQITKVISDAEINDIAYLYYDENSTKNLNFLSESKLNFKRSFVKGDEIKILGFPALNRQSYNSEYLRVKTHSCQIDGQLGTVKGYEGELVGTNCEGWFGISGGPVFVKSQGDTDFKWVGVVTHTFENLSVEGGTTQEREDAFGKYATTNFSPFYLAKQPEILTLDSPAIPLGLTAACINHYWNANDSTQSFSCNDIEASAIECSTKVRSFGTIYLANYKCVDVKNKMNLGKIKEIKSKQTQTASLKGKYFLGAELTMVSTPTQGLQVTQILKNSPAEKGGLELGGIITGASSPNYLEVEKLETIEDFTQFRTTLLSADIKFQVIRN